MLFRVRRLLLRSDRFLTDAALRVECGRVVEVLEKPGRIQGKTVDLDQGFVCPGFVNAHAHLELGGLAGRLTATGFVGWVRELVEARKSQGKADFARAFEGGVQRLLATGTTCVGDIDSSGVCEERAAPLRIVCFREVLDAGDPVRVPSALRRIQRALPKKRLFQEGLSPHAPYTTSPELLAGCAKILRRRPLPVAVHWAEIAEEEPWLLRGEGPLGELLRPPSTPLGQRGLELLKRSGLLDGRLLLIHGNHPAREDFERIARAGASVVHCPGTHRFFDRSAFPLRDYQRAGIPIALGTDSLASNEDLDMGREMELASQSFPEVEPREIFRWATEGGARALGLGDRLGRLEAGFEADFVQHPHEPADAREAVLALMGPARALKSWVAGSEVRTNADA
ncbi:MAG: hypothetical protein CMJ89_18190 [Planctomycetes bacterium]|nr:hypothetical protein [Planctomycetota bacterium]